MLDLLFFHFFPTFSVCFCLYLHGWRNFCYLISLAEQNSWFLQILILFIHFLTSYMWLSMLIRSFFYPLFSQSGNVSSMYFPLQHVSAPDIFCTFVSVKRQLPFKIQFSWALQALVSFLNISNAIHLELRSLAIDLHLFILHFNWNWNPSNPGCFLLYYTT